MKSRNKNHILIPICFILLKTSFFYSGLLRNKKARNFVLIILLPLFVLSLLWLNDTMSYDNRIGNTRFYLVRTMANSKDGKPLQGLYYQPKDFSGYVGIKGTRFPKIVLWNDKYLISKEFNGNDTLTLQYVVINMKSHVEPDSFSDIRFLRTHKDYIRHLRKIGLSESSMKQTLVNR